MSSKDAQMWTHFDVMDNILCEIKGRKKLVLWAPEEIGNLYVRFELKIHGNFLSN
jgi:hypothetical protein